MKFYYPKFLKSGPSFIGLSIVDLILLVASLFVSLILNLSSLQSLGVIFLAISVSKLVTLKYPRGHFQLYGLKRSVLDWKSDILKLTQGVFI